MCVEYQLVPDCFLGCLQVKTKLNAVDLRCSNDKARLLLGIVLITVTNLLKKNKGHTNDNRETLGKQKVRNQPTVNQVYG